MVKKSEILSQTIDMVWVVTALVWPVLRWLLAVNLFFQFVKSFFLNQAGNSLAFLPFLGHLAFYVAVIVFVTSHKTKKI